MATGYRLMLIQLRRNPPEGTGLLPLGGLRGAHIAQLLPDPALRH